MSAPPALLFSQMEPPLGKEVDFHDWYETDHIPARMRIEGFTRARRFRALDGEPRFLAMYELDSLDTLDRPEYSQLKADPGERTSGMLDTVAAFTRYTCVQLSDVGRPGVIGPIVSVVAFPVPAEDEQEFDDWYHLEHEPRLLECEDWLRIRRYKVADGAGGPWTHLAIHELANAEAMNSPARARARQAPLRAALADVPWFELSGRWLYEQISDHQ